MRIRDVLPGLMILGAGLTGCGSPPAAKPPSTHSAVRRSAALPRSLPTPGVRSGSWEVFSLPAGDRITGLAVGPQGQVAMGLWNGGRGRLGIWEGQRLTVYTPPGPPQGTIGPLTWGSRSVWFGTGGGVGRFLPATRRFAGGTTDVAGGGRPAVLAERSGTLFFAVGARHGRPATLAVRLPDGRLQQAPLTASTGPMADVTGVGVTAMALDGSGHPWILLAVGQVDNSGLLLDRAEGWREGRLNTVTMVRQDGVGQSGALFPVGITMGGRNLWVLTDIPARSSSPLGLATVNPENVHAPGSSHNVPTPPQGADVAGFTSVGNDLYLLLDDPAAGRGMLLRMRRNPWQVTTVPLPAGWAVRQGDLHLAAGVGGSVVVVAGNRLARLQP